MLLGGPSIIPALALVDPTFTMTAPPAVTANTGLDALCHAIEAYTSRKAQPLTDSFALSAIRKIHHNLPLCYQDGKNVEARLAMSLAALEAGIAFNNASVTIVHGMSRPIGALFHIAHGLSNAMLLPACLEFAIAENTARFADIGRVMGVADASTPDKEAALAMSAEVARFCKSLAVPTLAEKGVKQEDFFNQLSKMADDALESGSPQNTMRIPTKEQIMAIYRKLF
jgi:1,3-propanediol dehydrogenase